MAESRVNNGRSQSIMVANTTILRSYSKNGLKLVSDGLKLVSDGLRLALGQHGLRLALGQHGPQTGPKTGMASRLALRPAWPQGGPKTGMASGWP